MEYNGIQCREPGVRSALVKIDLKKNAGHPVVFDRTVTQKDKTFQNT